MDTDDLEPVRKPVPAVEFETLSIAELEAYIVARQADIERAREAIAAKQAARGGAEGVFRD